MIAFTEGWTWALLGQVSKGFLHPKIKAFVVPMSLSTMSHRGASQVTRPSILKLHDVQEWQVCQVSVGVLGDVCRALEEQMMPFCAELLPILLQNLQSNDVHRNVKPGILSCFGDIVLAGGDKFEVGGSALWSPSQCRLCMQACMHLLFVMLTGHGCGFFACCDESDTAHFCIEQSQPDSWLE